MSLVNVKLKQWHTTTYLFKWLKSKNWSTKLVRVQNNNNSHSLIPGMWNGKGTLKDVWQFLTKLNIQLLHDLVNHILRYSSKGLNRYIPIKTCTWIFVTAFYIIAKTWNQLRCFSVGEWENCGISIQRSSIQPEKEQTMERHRISLNAYC